MKISTFKKLLDKDFELSVRKIVYDLALRLNPFLENVNKALDKQLTFEDNFKCKVFEITSIKTDSTNVVDYSIDIGDLKPDGIIITYVYNLDDNDGSVLACPFFSWKKKDNMLNITAIYGLKPSVKYKIKFMVM